MWSSIGNSSIEKLANAYYDWQLRQNTWKESSQVDWTAKIVHRKHNGSQTYIDYKSNLDSWFNIWVEQLYNWVINFDPLE